MNAREFFYMVAEMRECQKAYFKSRDQLTLRAARKLENTIDKEIERVRSVVIQDTAAAPPHESPASAAAPPAPASPPDVENLS